MTMAYEATVIDVKASPIQFLPHVYGCDWCEEAFTDSVLIITFRHCQYDPTWVDPTVTEWKEYWHTRCWLRWCKGHQKGETP